MGDRGASAIVVTYTPLDPSDAVVLFADLQAGIIERAATNDLASLRRAVAALAKLARLPRPAEAPRRRDPHH